jgi:hypothetical protein
VKGAGVTREKRMYLQKEKETKKEKTLNIN